jgi:hypothetical protein
VLFGPVVGFIIAYKACKALARTDAHPIQKPVGGVIIRTAEGAYHTLGDHHVGDGDGHNGHVVDEAAVDEPAAPDSSSEPAAVSEGPAPAPSD